VAREDANASERMWLVQTLPSGTVRASGQWSLELTIDNQVIGRFHFSVSE